MAKIQGLSLSPTKINGICGRLMCCLGYETETYEEALKKMPKVGSEVSTPNGKGVVVYNDLLRERVSVKRQAEGDTFVVEDFDLDELNGKKKPEKVEIIEEKAEKNEHKENHQHKNKKAEPAQGLEIVDAAPENAEEQQKKGDFKKSHKNKKFHNKRK